MEKLSIEEKARRYDEAIKKVNDYYEGKTKLYSDVDKTLDYLFPALKESEDEKMKRQILELVSIAGNGNQFEEIKDWLEKQDEQKESPCDRCKRAQPSHSCQDITELGRCYLEHEKQGEHKQLKKIEQEYHCSGVREPKEATGVLKQLLNKENHAWSEEDKVKINRIVAFLENLNLECLNAAGNDILLKDIEWLKSLKDRVQPQPKQEWSKYDDDILTWICKIIFSTRQRGGITQQEEKELGDWIDKWLNHKPITLDNEFEQHVDSLLKRLGGVCRCELVRTRFAISEDEEWLKSLKFKCNIVKGISKYKLLKKIQELEDKNNCGTYDFIESKRIAFEQVKEVIEKL